MTTLAEVKAAAVALNPDERKQLEALLCELREQENEEYLKSLYKKTGVHPLPKRPGGQTVTNEIIDRIREEEGI